MIDATDSILRKEIINSNKGFQEMAAEFSGNCCDPSLIKCTKDRFYTAFLASFAAALGSLNFGYTLGYTAPTEHGFTNDNKDGHLTVTKSEFALFSSLMAIGAIFGSFIGGYSVEKFGRKSTILLTSLLYTPGWCLISYAKLVSMLYTGRFLTGLAVGMSSLSVPLYIAEVASARLRGGLGSVNQLAVTVGILLSYIVGFSLSKEWTAMFAVMLVALMVIMFVFMPETPHWLLSHNRRRDAENGLKWLRGPNYDVDEELFVIENNLDQQNHVNIQEFLKPGLYKPLIIGTFLMIFQQFCGINAVIFYCASIFKSASVGNVEAVSLGVASAQVVATFCACLIVDKSGRRILLMVGAVVMFICTLLLGIYYDIAQLDTEKHISIFGSLSHSVPLSKISWLAILCVMIYVVIFSLGWGPLPWLLMSEIFPPRARGLASALVTFVNWFFVFVITFSFHSMTTTLYEQGTFWFFSAFSLLSFVFTLFFVPETKGRTLEEIEIMLS